MSLGQIFLNVRVFCVKQKLRNEARRNECVRSRWGRHPSGFEGTGQTLYFHLAPRSGVSSSPKPLGTRATLQACPPRWGVNTRGLMGSFCWSPCFPLPPRRAGRARPCPDVIASAKRLDQPMAPIGTSRCTFGGNESTGCLEISPKGR